MTQEPTQTQTEPEQNENWLQQEADQLGTQTQFDGEKLPALKFEENKIVAFTVDFTNKFQKWDDTENKSRKAIIPVTHGEDKKILWLNVKNPLYSEIVKAGTEGKTEFKVLQTGTQKNTKYNIVKD